MRKYLILFGILILILIPKSKYLELNHLKIIDSLSLTCNSNHYEITLSEVIPKREDNSIELDHHHYSYRVPNLYDLVEIIEKEHFYLKKSDITIYNCNNIDEISYIFKVSKNKIKRK